MNKPKAPIQNLVWHPIETEEAARLARMPSLVFAIFGAFIWFVIAIATPFKQSIYGYWAIVSAIIFIIIAFGLYKMRREAAIAAFVVSFIGLIFHWGNIKMASDALMMIVDVLAIRGIFSYAHLIQSGRSV